MRAVYLEQGALNQAEFDQLAEQAFQIGALKVLNRNWSITQQILSEHRHIPLLVHYEALSAAYGFPFSGVESFHINMIRKGILPPWTLNRTIFHWTPQERLRIGQLMKELGLINQETLDSSLGIQSAIQQELGTKVALGAITLGLTHLSYPDFFQVLGLQAKIPYRGLDESAAKIFDGLSAQLAGEVAPGAAPAI